MGDFNPLDFSDRVILVTGASSGIGRASAIYLSRLGAAIILVGRNKERLQETQDQLQPGKHYAISCDLSQTDAIEFMMKDAVSHCGKLNGFVNCAGIPYVMPLNVLTPQHMDEVLKTNLYPFIEISRLFGKKKYASGGSIVTISSILTSQPRANESGYIISKGAMETAVKSMACDLSPKGIRVNGIVCGNVMTEMVKRTMEELNNKDYLTVQMNRGLLGIAEPDDIASVVAFLISDMSKFITGRNLYADGGLF